MNESQISLDILECGRRLYQKGFVASNDGNLSVRISDHEFLATATGVSKGFMRPEDIVKVDQYGKLIQGDKRPSTEIKMHQTIYEVRSDVKAVVHAHPPYATGFATAGIELKDCVLAEIVTTLGSIPLASYATPSTHELPDSIREIMKKADACLLANHGAVTCGESIYDAYYKMERLEHYAKIIFIAKMLGGERILNKDQVQKLEEIRSVYGTTKTSNPGCVSCEGDCIGHDCSLYNKKIEKAEIFDHDYLNKMIMEIINSR